ncbi:MULTISPECIES: hypothetical protein [Kitasatospora]|uniref:hypothetical protein n=1 Tax=Kitasatospora TaxID=2063 RepID=UPI0004BEDC32|nr:MULTISPECIES: hypothetical protein [Kitasatospora]
MFTEPGCDGDFFTLRPLTGRGSASRFAMAEAVLVLATVAQRFRFEAVTPGVPPHAALSLRPARPIRATVCERTRAT